MGTVNNRIALFALFIAPGSGLDSMCIVEPATAPAAGSIPEAVGDGYVLEKWGDVGTLVIPVLPPSGCQRLKIFFPGHAQELGYKGEVPAEDESRWAKYLLGPGNYHLGPSIAKSGCPVLILGDSHKALGVSDLNRLLEKFGVAEIEVLSHSGGCVGFQASISEWPDGIVKKIKAIELLDNFYEPTLAKTLSEKLGVETLKKICGGYFTAHNEARYDSYFREGCPGIVKKSDHKSPVASYF